MGFFGPFEYKNKKGDTFWLHARERGKTKIYFFNKDSIDSLSFLPSGYVVIENKLTGMPLLKKNESDIFSMMSAPKGKKSQESQ